MIDEYNDLTFKAKLLYAMLISRCPKDMFNLVKTIGYQVYPDSIVFHIGGDELLKFSKAPYAVFTNEKWTSPRWRGKKNPNEKWIDNSIKQWKIMTGGVSSV